MADHQSCSSGSRSSYTRFLCKSFFFALCLFAIPLFPSQAPDFINQNLLTQFWELLHLLFVGIAVSYGLFCRRNVHAGTDHFVDPQPFGSNMFQVSSIFEDGYDCYSCGSDEKNLYQNWSWKYSESSRLSEQNQFPGLVNDKGDVVQAWNSQYFRGDSMVVVAQPNCNLDGFAWKPLGLPVRSLRSRVRKRDGAEVFSGGSSDVLRNEKYGNLGGENLEEKFNSSCFASENQPIPWHSRSEGMDGCGRPSHFRPVSVDQIQFESLRSRSLRSTVSFSPQASSLSDSPSRLPSSSSAGSLESQAREMGGKGRSSRQSFPPTSPAKPTSPTQLSGKASLHSRHFSYGSSLEGSHKRGFEDEMKEFYGQQNDALGSLETEAKPSGLTKSLARGKSVRTYRAKRSNEVQAVYQGESEPSEDFFTGKCYVPRPTSPVEHKIENEDYPEPSSMQSEEESKRQDVNLGSSSDEETVSEAVADVVEDDSYEVDKKAGEFIAKFRQQIKLQKMGSVETPRGSNASSSAF